MLKILFGSKPLLLSNSHCYLLFGNPSNIQPYFWQSAIETLFYIKSTIFSLDNIFPFLNYYKMALIPKSLCSTQYYWIMLSKLTLTKPNFLLTAYTKVVLPVFVRPITETLGITLTSFGIDWLVSNNFGLLITLSRYYSSLR